MIKLLSGCLVAIGLLMGGSIVGLSLLSIFSVPQVPEDKFTNEDNIKKIIHSYMLSKEMIIPEDIIEVIEIKQIEKEKTHATVLVWFYVNNSTRTKRKGDMKLLGIEDYDTYFKLQWLPVDDS